MGGPTFSRTKTLPGLQAWSGTSETSTGSTSGPNTGDRLAAATTSGGCLLTHPAAPPPRPAWRGRLHSRLRTFSVHNRHVQIRQFQKLFLLIFYLMSLK